jgi:hypothetical protein
MILRRYFFSVALIVTLHLVSTSPVSAETTADAKNNSANFWGTFQANPPGFKAYDWDTYSNSKDNGLWSSAFTFTNGVKTTRLRKEEGDRSNDLLHNSEDIMYHIPDSGIASAYHYVKFVTEDEDWVSGKLASKAVSHQGDIQAIGTLEMVFIKEKAVAENENFASIVFENLNTTEGKTGVDYKLEMFRRRYGFFYGSLEPLKVQLTDKVVDKPIKPRQGEFQSFKTDLTQLETGDLLFIKLTTRAWANGTKKEPPEFPTPAGPEPATWLLGLTGLAGVVGTQAWKSRRQALRS